ncbi:MAG: UDP-N-acetylmuramoyl-tripeptide--D-alanyl-D-alanine ligase [Oscillospiraceae bacterium]
MIPCTIQEICAAVGGTLLQDSPAGITGVTTDSRAVSAGQLFIPLTGERFDGHAYIDAALTGGAEGCLTARRPDKLLPHKAYVLVEDTRLALGALAAWYRSRFALPVVQITGSAGKTTTKEMVAAVLSQRYDTLKTQANYNNDIGTPLTLLNLTPQHEAAVIETGMNHFGEIRYLGGLVRPDIAVITNVGDAHIENLGNTRQGILQAKCEIFEHLPPDGLAVLNGDDPLLNTVALPQTVLRCGRGGLSDPRHRRGRLRHRGYLLHCHHRQGQLSSAHRVPRGVHDLPHGYGRRHRRSPGPDGGGDHRRRGLLCPYRLPHAGAAPAGGSPAHR